MGRYKEEYSYDLTLLAKFKSMNSITADDKCNWSCRIVDRQTDEWVGFSSGHDSKAEAKEAAWDDFYKKKEERKEEAKREKEKIEEDEDYDDEDEDYDDEDEDYDDEDEDYDDEGEDNGYLDNYAIVNHQSEYTHNININNPNAPLEFVSTFLGGLFGLLGKIMEFQQKAIENIQKSATFKTIVCFNLVCNEIDDLDSCITVDEMIEKCCFNGIAERDAKYVINKFIRAGCLVNSEDDEDYYCMDIENSLYIKIQERAEELRLAAEQSLHGDNKAEAYNQMLFLLNSPL